MHVLLLQNSPCIKDLSRELINNYPASAVIETSGLSFPEKRPILKDKWLIRLVLRRNGLKQIQAAAKISDIANFIFVVHNRIDTIQKLLNEQGLGYYVIDNLRPSKEILLKYVKSKLDVSDTAAEHVLVRSNWYEPLIIKNVQLLSLVTGRKLTSTDVDKYLQDNSGVNFSYLYKYILLGEGSYKKIVKLVYRYQMAPHVLCQYLVDRLSQDVELFLEVMDGNLSKENYFSYAERNKVSEKAIKDALFLMERVTLETLYAKKILFESLLGENCIQFILKGCK